MSNLTPTQLAVLRRLAERWHDVMRTGTTQEAVDRTWVLGAGQLRTLDALRKRGLIENKVGTREARITMAGLDLLRARGGYEKSEP